MGYYLLSIAYTDRQCLTYRIDKLEDGHGTFESYGIEDGATIFVSQIGAAFPIYIDFPTGEKIQVLMEGINTIANLKSRFHAWVSRGKGAKFLTRTRITDYTSIQICNS